MRFKKMISSVLAFAMAISIVPAASLAAETVSTTLYGDDFESYNVSAYPKPKPDGITIIGDNNSVYVDTVGESKRLWLKNDGFVKSVQVKKSFTEIVGKTVTFELDFLQLYTTSEGDTILGIYSDETPVVLLETYDGDITYSIGESKRVIVDNYDPNRVYSFKINVDLFGNKADVYSDGDLAGTYSLINATGKADNFRISASELPGFTVDNIKVYLEEDINSVKISGDEKLVIPAYDTAEYEYSAQVFDGNNSAINTVDLEWSLAGAPQGVSLISSTGKKVKISVSKDATEGTFSLNAKVKDSETYGTISLATEPLQPSKLEIVGWADSVTYRDKNGDDNVITYPSYRITAEDREAKTYKFKTKLLDQFGNEVESFGNYTWSLFDVAGEEVVPDYVSINASTGVVTVKKNPTKEQLIGIRAVANNDTSLIGETKISVLGYDTYLMDKTRFDAVIQHVETAMEAGSIEGSPMISDLILRGDKRPIYILDGLKDTMESNVMSQSTLMRTMYNLSALTGDEKYRDRVNAIYANLMNNGVLNNGVQLSWGGHLTFDMEENKPLAGMDFGTHEIKGISPFITPMFEESVNFENPNDSYNNGFGNSGLFVRMMISGHAKGEYETLEFERHWEGADAAKYATIFEPIWQSPELFDDERRGPVQRTGGAPFNVAASNLIDILLEYYKVTGDEHSLSWAANFMKTILNSACTYFVYKDSEGNYIWPSDTTNMEYRVTTNEGQVGEEPKRKYYDKNNELRYTSVKSDTHEMSNVLTTTSFFYEHRDVAEYDSRGNVTDIVKVIDVKTGEETELTLYNVWSNGSFGESGNMLGEHYKLEFVTQNLGYNWWLHPDYRDVYGGPAYGDRLYNQAVLGTSDPTDKDNWVEQGLLTEEEAPLMNDSYVRMRGIHTVDTIITAMAGCIDALFEAGRDEEALECLENCSRGLYNDLKLTYSFNTDTYWSYMTWIRPAYMRSHEIVSYKDSTRVFMEKYAEGSEEREFWEKYGELPWNVEMPTNGKDDHDTSEKNKMYFRGNKEYARTVHAGYYGNPGEVTYGEKSVEAPHIISTMNLCKTLRETIERLEATPQTDPNYEKNMDHAAIFRNRLKYFWKVMRDMLSDKIPIGDIGEDFFNPDPELDMATTASDYKFIEMAMVAYKALGDKEFLKLARAMANNYMRKNHISNEQAFSTGSNYFISSADHMLELLWELDALLLDRLEENKPYSNVVRGNVFYDTWIYQKDGSFRQKTGFARDGTMVYPNDSVKVQEVKIKHDVIELKVGESIKVQYEVIPWDAAAQSVTWDVYDQRVAMMNTDTTTLYGLKKGKTKIRCVSSQMGMASKEVEVIVK